MKLYWGKGTCAIGIHILLEEAGLDYQTIRVDVGGGETHQTPFLAINPKGKVPTLVHDDGSVLTEFGAIATWIARQAPGAGLLPADPDSEARAIEVIAYVEGTIHGQGYARLFAPDQFASHDPRDADFAAAIQQAKDRGREIVSEGFALLDQTLADRDFAVGGHFTTADAALFYVERWAPKQDMELPSNVARHYDRMLTRPAVDRVRQLWGEA